MRLLSFRPFEPAVSGANDDLPEVDRLPGYPTHQRASCAGDQETLLHLLRPAGYQSAQQPAPVRASRQRTYVTNLHRLMLPCVALREKMCGAERQSNSVHRWFISRSATRCIISESLRLASSVDVRAQIGRVRGVVVMPRGPTGGNCARNEYRRRTASNGMLVAGRTSGEQCNNSEYSDFHGSSVSGGVVLSAEA